MEVKVQALSMSEEEHPSGIYMSLIKMKKGAQHEAQKWSVTFNLAD